MINIKRSYKSVSIFIINREQVEFMSSWLVNLNSKFAEEFDIRFDGFIVKEEEKEEFLIKMNKIAQEVVELTDLKLNEIDLFECKEIKEKCL
jgi:hypothetical protein